MLDLFQCAVIGAVLLVVYALPYFLIVNSWLRGIASKAVFITGCDSGFGRALAKRLDGCHVPVFAGCLTEEGAKALRGECSATLKTIILDVSSAHSISRAYEYVKNNLEKDVVLWGLVNNAGITSAGGPLEFVTNDDYLRTIQVNLLGPIEVTRTFLPLLKWSRGRIVNTASIAGVFAVPSADSPYVVSKFGLVGYSDILRREKAEWGIKVSCVEPSNFKTQIYDPVVKRKLRTERWLSASKELREEYGEDFLEKDLALYNNFVNKNVIPDVSAVVDAYEHALFGRYPKAHYAVGTLAKLLTWMQMLPPSLSDAIMPYIRRPIIPKILT